MAQMIDNLNGKLLVAMPHMDDKRFDQAVILLCAHDEKGAMGITLNKPMPDMDFGQMLSQLTIQDFPTNGSHHNIMWGGPVDTMRGFIMHDGGYRRDETVHIHDNFFVTGSVEALSDMASGTALQKARFALGHAGWQAGQLENELQSNVWMVIPASTHLVFECDYTLMWEQAFHSIGIHPQSLSHHVGRA